jgi:hypothetical protein
VLRYWACPNHPGARGGNARCRGSPWRLEKMCHSAYALHPLVGICFYCNYFLECIVPFRGCAAGRGSAVAPQDPGNLNQLVNTAEVHKW